MSEKITLPVEPTGMILQIKSMSSAAQWAAHWAPRQKLGKSDNIWILVNNRVLT